MSDDDRSEKTRPRRKRANRDRSGESPENVRAEASSAPEKPPEPELHQGVAESEDSPFESSKGEPAGLLSKEDVETLLGALEQTPGESPLFEADEPPGVHPIKSRARSRSKSVSGPTIPSTVASVPPEKPQAGAGAEPAGTGRGKRKSIPVPVPIRIPILPLRTDVAFPGIVTPLVVGRDKGIRLIDDVLRTEDRRIGLVTQKIPDIDDPVLEDLQPFLCIANLLKMLKFPDGSTRIVVQGTTRARLIRLVGTSPYMMAEVFPLDDVVEKGVELDALVLTARKMFNQLVESGGQLSEELQVAVMNTHEAGPLSDLLASGLPLSTEQRQELLTEVSVAKRLKRLTQLQQHLSEMQDISSRIQGEVSSEINKAQREQFLRQQLAAIRRELGDEDENSEVEEFSRKIEELKLSETTTKEARRELDRMAQMHPSTPEYHVIRTYLDTLLSMPWHNSTEDRIDVRRARKILDEDHYDLLKVKERILEFLAVRKLKKDMRGPILCFVGPPGVGKTSLGRSIARTMGRKFIRVSLGGVHDEAEIRGHRRTYIGAMPGRIVQHLRKLGVNNPVFMLDEIDKLGSDFRGDPASALLEVLDPEQNSTFRDHYLDAEFDLSKVTFICTANSMQTIPPPLLDRMEIIEIPGYGEEDKLVIAKRYLVPRQKEENGLPTDFMSVSDEALREIIEKYTREAGVRNLEREIGSVCRKVARQRAEGKMKPQHVDAKRVGQLLGPPKYLRDDVQAVPGIGYANGLAWTPLGGEVLTIESIKAVTEKPALKLTGSLGDVMKESAHAALGFLQSHAGKLGIGREFFEKTEIHIHVPAGAISKDGPSAGVALSASLLSLAMDRPLRPGLAMTGEITLAGRILPVGGIREKVLAARRERLGTVILPLQNVKDLEDIPKELRDDVKVIGVRHMDEVIPLLFETSAGPPKSPRPRRPSGHSPRKAPAPVAVTKEDSTVPPGSPTPAAPGGAPVPRPGTTGSTGRSRPTSR